MIVPGPARRHVDLECDLAAQALAGCDSGSDGWFGHAGSPGLQRLLLVPTMLAGELDAGCALFCRQPVRAAALAADGLDPRVALLDDKVALFHGFADQPFGLFPHRLFGHQVSRHGAAILSGADDSLRLTAQATKTCRSAFPNPKQHRNRGRPRSP